MLERLNDLNDVQYSVVLAPNDWNVATICYSLVVV